jgi:hypothetical protein
MHYFQAEPVVEIMQMVSHAQAVKAQFTEQESSTPSSMTDAHGMCHSRE